jgi:hypothetical protein
MEGVFSAINGSPEDSTLSRSDKNTIQAEI